MATLLEQAAILIRAGNIEEARPLLIEYLKQNPGDENAWLWMSRCVAEGEQKRYCFEKVLKINPQNQYAIKGLERLNKPVPQPPQPTTVQQPAPQVKQKKNNLLLIFLAAIGLLGVVCICGGSTALFMLYDKLGAVSTTPTPSTLYPLPMNGITQESFASYLGEIGINCKPSEPNEPYGYLVYCDGKSPDGRIEISVEVSSRDENDYVYLITAVLHQNWSYSEQTVNDILGHIAAIPYSGAEPNQARDWMMAHLQGNNRPTQRFGGIQYEMSCNFAVISRCLSIGEEAQAP